MSVASANTFTDPAEPIRRVPCRRCHRSQQSVAQVDGAAILKTARHVAFDYAMPRHLLSELDDLTQTAALAGWDAVLRYDPSRGVPLGTWVLMRMRWSMYDGGRMLPGSRQELLRGESSRRPIPLDAADHAKEPGDQYADVDTRTILDVLPTRERQVIAATVMEDRTLREVGAALGVSESRACQIRTRALARLRAGLG